MGFKYIPVASALHDERALEKVTGGLEEALKAIGGVRAEGEGIAAGEVPFHFVRTGGVEEEVMRRLEAWRARGGKGPVLVVAHGGHNSLPASLEILARVRQIGGRGKIYMLRGADDAETLGAIARTAKAMDANRKLAGERIGQVGAPSGWLVASSQGAETVRRRFGAKLVPVTLEEVRARMAEEEKKPLDAAGKALWEGAAAREGVGEAAYGKAAALYRALRAVAEEYRLSAVTVRCFDWVQQDGTTGCLALARLADEGISAGCEGDVPSILMLRWLWHLTGRAAWMANPAAVDPATGEMALAHCTVPFGLVGRYSFKTHFESGLGVGIDGTLPKGAVTLLRLGGADLERWWCAEGEITADTHEDGQCRTQVRVRVAPEAVRSLLEDPLGNHVIVAPGHVRALVEEAAGLL
jgi:L-fucose isomerase-like protein